MIEESPSGFVDRQLPLGHFNVSLNNRQKVIEIMGDATGQHPEGLEFSGAQQFFFCLLPLGYLGSQMFRRFVQFGGALLDPEFECLVQGGGLLVCGPQIVDQVPVLQLQPER